MEDEDVVKGEAIKTGGGGGKNTVGSSFLKDLDYQIRWFPVSATSTLSCHIGQ